MAFAWPDFPAPSFLRALLLGRPGSGKGTQGSVLAEILGIPHVSMGDLLRTEIERKSRIGEAVRRTVCSGRLVPDALVLEALEARLRRDDVRARGFLLDGFPRSVSQATDLERVLAPTRVDVAIELLLSEREAAHRLHARFVCDDCGQSPTRVIGLGTVATLPQCCARCGGTLRRRADDEVRAIRRRFEEYERLTKPLLEGLDARHMLVTVDADRPASVVTSSVVDALRGRAVGPRLATAHG